ncbi:MAG: hypothetical protein QM504_17965 [Pseudomonadota bacterium]
MKNKQIKLLCKLFTIILFTYTFNSFAQDLSASGFEQALTDTGWSVQKNAQGDIILNVPKQPHQTKLKNSIDITKLADELAKGGWKVQQKEDGSLVFFTPEPLQKSKENSNNYLDCSNQVETYKKAVKHIRKNPDCSSQIEAYKKSVKSSSEVSDCSSQIEAYKKSFNNPLQVCSGIVPSIDISMPVDTWQKAHDISKDWLTNQSIKQATVGKIRQIFNVYLVSIVEEKEPFALLHQIAIKAKNGNVITLY